MNQREVKVTLVAQDVPAMRMGTRPRTVQYWCYLMDKAAPVTFLIFITPTQVFEKILGFSSGQYVAKNNSTWRIRDGKEW